MPKVYVINSPHNPQDKIDISECQTGMTLDVVGARFIGQPWICIAYIDGKQCFPLRNEWGNIALGPEDTIYFFPKVAGAPEIIYAVITIIVAIASYALAPEPPDPKRTDLGQADPVFNLTGEKNQVRLNQPIEDPYGRCRLWPSVASLSYNNYVDNDQFLYQLLCLGQGSYDVEQVYIEDTPIENFQETEFEVYQPGESVDLFRDNVNTSTEVGRLELFGPNEGAYTGPIGPFVANNVGTKADRLEIDLEFPQGCYINTGAIAAINVTALAELREIDSNGDPLGPWGTFASFNQTLADLQPQRFTLIKTVTPGRYEIRVARTSNKNLSSTAVNLLQWTGLRAFLTSTNDYGDVTMLAIKARATNNLNDASSQKFNVVGTRKLPVYDGSTIPAPGDSAGRTTTRNPVWAFVNLFRASYAGNLADEYLDLDFLKSEADALDTAGVNFDYIYDQKTTVWEAAKVPAFVAKAVPILNGSRVAWSRDTGSTFPTFFLNPENTVQNSFQLQKKLYDLNENDGLEVEYKDEETWSNETVLCVVGDQLGLNPKKTTIRGVQNRQAAYELGIYQWAKEVYERQLITIKTGLEGYIPAYGDIARIASDVPRWGESGYVLDIDGTTLTLSEAVHFQEGQVHQIAIRGKHGQDLGPYGATPGTEPNQVVIDDTIPAGETFLDHYREPPYFVFGVINYVGRICRVVDIQPGDGDTITIKALVDDQRRLDDPGTAPTLGSTPFGYPGAVTLDPPPSAYIASAFPFDVEIIKQNAAAIIRWSKTAAPSTWNDGNEYTGPISMSAGETLYARAFLAETFAGDIVSGAYTIVPNLDFEYGNNSQYLGVL